MDLSVLFGDLRFRGFADHDDYGFWIAKGGWTGWETPPAQRADVLARATTHGTFDALQLFDAREVTQAGFFRARTLPELNHMAEALAGQLDGEERTLTVHYGHHARWAKFKRSLSEPSIVTSSDGTLHVGEYEIVHRMSDPRKYGLTNKFTGASVRPFHRGNFPATPEITVTGSMPNGYTINGPQGKRYVVAQALSTGQTHRIDFNTGWLYRNDVLQQGVYGRVELWDVPGGQPSIVMSLAPESGTGSMVVRVRDTLI